MQKDLLVSVIIPNYNHAKYLDERIQSILNQTYQNFEIIILDDSSTDNSIEVINKYKDNPQVSHVIINEVNSGSPFIQWQKGFNLAKGDLIWIAESDDNCDDSFLMSLVPFFKEKEVVMAFTRSKIVDELGKEKGIFHTQRSLNVDMVFEKSLFIRERLKKNNIVINASSVVFRKDILFQIPNEYRQLRGCGDWLLWIYLSEKGKVAYCSNPLNKFRQHGSNTTTKQDRNGENEKEIKYIFDYLNGKHYYSYWERIKFVVSRMAFHDLVCPFSSPSLDEQFKRLWNISFVHKCYYAKQRLKWKTHVLMYKLIHMGRK